MKPVIFPSLLVLAGPAPAGAASYGCGRAATITGKASCDDAHPRLGSRDACGADAACLPRVRDARLREPARAGGVRMALRSDSRHCPIYCGVHAGFNETYARAE